jgi:hypothetical protein
MGVLCSASTLEVHGSLLILEIRLLVLFVIYLKTLSVAETLGFLVSNDDFFVLYLATIFR